MEQNRESYNYDGDEHDEQSERMNMYSFPIKQSDLYVNIEPKITDNTNMEPVYESAPDVPSKDIIGEHYMDTVFHSNDGGGNGHVALHVTTSGHNNVSKTLAAVTRNTCIDYENVDVDFINTVGDIAEVTLAENEVYG